jgi:hypothetical protein
VLACGGKGAVRPLVEAGTHRNDSGYSQNVAGISVLQGGEDVNKKYKQNNALHNSLKTTLSKME